MMGVEWWRNHPKHLKVTFIRINNFLPLFRGSVHMFCYFAITIRCFFILSVRSGLLAASQQGKLESFWMRSCIVQNEMFWSSTGCRFVTSNAVNWCFVWISILKKVSAAYEVFLPLPPPKLCFGTALFGSPLAEDKGFIIVDLALLLCLHIFLLVLFFSPGKNTNLLVIITVYFRHDKMVLRKINTSLMIYTKLSLMQQNTSSWMMSPEDLNSSNFKMIMT